MHAVNPRQRPQLLFVGTIILELSQARPNILLLLGRQAGELRIRFELRQLTDLGLEGLAKAT